ncbi:MAG: adenosylcobinamide-GDP ribazoletransferase [Defluviicoccus sp.]|nr:MAG: adenosylcobinamide-GDP ribazoletransferase [Defluviicoccus sp.]
MVDIPGALFAWWHKLRLAASFLTRLPVAPRSVPMANAKDGEEPATMAPGDLARSAALFPVVGAGIGVVSALVLLMVFELRLAPLACALLALAAGAVITGALHEDGLADFADGLGGGHARKRRLAIMRDSRIGTCGALAIVFSVGVRAAILSGLSSPDVAALALIAAAAVSRATLPAVMRWQAPARPDGMAASIGAPPYRQVMAAGALALIIALLTLGFWAALAVCIAAGLAAVGVAAAAERTLGGQTGDVLGAAQVISELAVLVAIAAME